MREEEYDMVISPQQRQQTSCQEFTAFIAAMDGRKKNALYEKDRAYWYWFTAQWTVLLAGAVGALIAVLVRKENYQGGWKLAIVVLPALSSLGSTVLVNLRLPRGGPAIELDRSGASLRDEFKVNWKCDSVCRLL